MSRTYKGRDRRIRIRSQRRNPPDIRKLGAAIIAMAKAQHEKEAQEALQRGEKKTTSPHRHRPRPTNKPRHTDA